ncbi:hypothetical protein D3C80_2164160 [compost metagenome]
MHGNVCPAFQQSQLKFFDEQALTANLGQRRIQNDVAARDHRHQFHLQARMASHQTLLNIVCLP